MKYLFLLFICFISMASNWVPVSKIQSGSSQAYQLEAECQKSGEQCLDVGDEPQIVSLGFTSLTDHYLKIDEQECSDQSDCDAKFIALVCSQDDYEKIENIDLLQVYCVKFVGKNLVKDESAFNSYKTQKDAAAQTEALISNGKHAREDCQRVLDLIGGFNLLPGRSQESINSMVETFAEAKRHLQDGRPGAAKAAIQSIPVDGVLVTQPMKDLALAQLSAW